MTGSAKNVGLSTRLYLHDIPVTYDSIGPLGTWFLDQTGNYHCVFGFGKVVYQCVKSKPYRGHDCPRCSFEGTIYKCGGSCVGTDGGIKV